LLLRFPLFVGLEAATSQTFDRAKDAYMHINEDAVSFAAFSLSKILAAELLRNGVLDRDGLVSAILIEVEALRRTAAPTNEDAATLLTVYCDEI